MRHASDALGGVSRITFQMSTARWNRQQ